jgi:hypothetical protein
MLYKIDNGLIDIDSHQYIQSNDSRIRGKDCLYPERTSSEAFGNSFFPKTISDCLEPTAIEYNSGQHSRGIQERPDSN